MQYAVNRLIDSVWTLEFDIVDDKIQIHSHNRENPVGYELEHELPNFLLHEDDSNNQRTVVGVDLFNVPHKYFIGIDTDSILEYPVANPGNIFSYKTPELTDETTPLLKRGKDELTKLEAVVPIEGTGLDINVALEDLRTSLAGNMYSNMKDMGLMKTPRTMSYVANQMAKVIKLDAKRHFDKLTITLEQDAASPFTIRTATAKDAVEELLNGTHFKLGKDVQYSGAELENDKPVRTMEGVKEELANVVDNKYDVQVTQQSHGAFLIEVRGEHGLTQRLPSYQPSFETEYAKLKRRHAAPVNDTPENSASSPRMKR
jgi:hypothetical protein